ncbi:MAG: porin [Gammaproteobacteria bacterium]|nr:porin [Gammaproteobacteria bacterium]
MKKTIIAAAITAGMAASMAANADVTVYSQMYAGINSLGGDAAGVTQNDNDGRGRLGFKTSEELGGGMTAFAKLELQIDINDTVAAGGCDKNYTAAPNKSVESVYCQRDSFVGIKAAWGSVAAGRFHGAYKTAGGVKFDPFVATALQARGNGGMAKGAYASNGFISQLVEYKSPKVAGVQVQYQTSVLDDDNDATKTGSEGDALMAITYTGVKGLKVIYSTAKQAGTTTGGTQDKSNSKFGAQYKINDAMKVTFQSESVEAAANGAGDLTYMNFSYKMGKHNFVIANGSFAGDNAAHDMSYTAFGDIIKLNKTTHLIVGQRTTGGTGKVAAPATANADKSVTSLTIGLRKNF